ncbi:MAG: efflux RND transporter periplasmic adaptor subunit [Hyphomicrobium sp.]
MFSKFHTTTAGVGLATAGALALVLLVSGAVGFRLGTGAWPDWAALTSGDGPGAADNGKTSAGAPKERKVLYYRNPMGLAETSPVPKKDWMGMDFIPVYEGEEADDGSTVKISLDRVQRSGVRTQLAQKRRLVRPVRAPGVAKHDERSMHAVTLRADGFIEKLYVEETGAHIKAGQPLFRIYSPDMVNAQVDYRIGLPDSSVRGRRSSLKGAKQKLRNLEVPDAVIEEMRRTGEPVMSFDWPSPADGYIMKKNVVEGQMVRMGDEIFRIAGLENIWVIADVAEQDAGLVTVGQPANVRFRAFPSEVYKGRVTFILHELDAATRTAKVRIEIDNPQHRIKHEMYADVDIDTTLGDEPRVAVPNSAVIDSGNRQVVIVARGEGRFEPRSVTLGLRGEDYTEIKEGIAAGEEVVVAANFLIDAESNLKAALSSFTADDASKPMKAAGGMNHSLHDKATPPAEEQHP